MVSHADLVLSEVAQLDELAAAMCRQASAAARATLAGCDAPALPRNPFDHSRYRIAFGQALLLAVAQVLGAHDQRVVAVYACHDPPEAATPTPAGGARAQLLVLVTAPSAALEVLVAALGRALSASLADLTGCRLCPSEGWLDISIVTEQQAQQGIGLARLLALARPKPVKLWQRNV